MNKVLSLVSTNPLNKFIITDKIGAILNPEYEPTLLFLTGASNTGKSVIGGMKVYFLCMKYGGNGYFISKSKSKVVQLFVDNEFSILKMFPNNTRYVGGNTGSGERIEITTPFGTSKIYLANYDNAKSWQNVLGTSAQWFLIDEADQSAEQLLSEVKLRAIRNKGMAILTSNGNSPSNHLYKITDEFYPITQFGKFPQKELSYFKPKNKKWHCIHFNAYDDLVHMDQETKQEFLNAFAPGTYYHNTKIEGVRAAIGKLPYMRFVKSCVIESISQELKTRINGKSAGIDLSFSKKSSDKSVMVIKLRTWDGYTIAFKEVSMDNSEYPESPVLSQEFVQICYNHLKSLDMLGIDVFIDQEDANFINTFRKMYPQMSIHDSWKHRYSRFDRMNFRENQMALGKYLVLKHGCPGLIYELENATIDPKTGLVEVLNHYIDADDYADMPFYEDLR